MTILDDTNLEAPVTDEKKEYLPDLVGEGKKYKTQEDLAKAAVFKDQHIARIEREAAEMRETIKTLSATKRVEELLDQMQALQSRSTPAPSTVDTPREPASTSAGLTPEDVSKIVDARDEKRRREGNTSVVRNRLVAEYGAEFVQKVKEQAARLGLSAEYLDNTAQTNPQAFYQLMGLTAHKTMEVDTPYAPPRSVATPGFKPSGSDKNWAYYENMRKTDPSRYHSVAIAIEMDREALKAAREGRDFGTPQ